MENPWAFFDRVCVISLEDAEDRRSTLKPELERFPGLKYEIVKAVDGRKNPILRRWFELTHVTSSPYPQTNGALGCFASHRRVYQMVLEDAVKFPSWTLVLEDDMRFHPMLTNDIMKMYLANVPPDAQHLKFGYLKKDSVTYSRANKYWWNLSQKSAYSTIAYAIRSDVLPNILAARDLSVSIDCLMMDHTYGAAMLEDACGLPDTSEFRKYENPNTDKPEYFWGFAGVADYPSTTMTTSKDKKVVYT